MSPAKSITSPLRFLTPGQLGICLVLFFMPWVEVQCPMPKGGMNFNLDVAGKAPPKPAMPEVMWTSFITQSGLQATTGDYSFSDSLMRQMAKEKGGQKESIPAAPILWGYMIAVVVGIGVGLAMPLGGTRKVLLLVCCAGALATAGGQAAIGFPIAKEIEEEMKKDKLGGPNKGLGGGGLGMGGGDAGGFDMGPPKGLPGLDDLAPKTVIKFSFYLALLFAAGALVTTVLEPTRGRADTKKPRKYDFDGEGEELEADEVDADEEPPKRPRGEGPRGSDS